MKFALMIVVTCLAAADKFFMAVSEKCFLGKRTVKKSLSERLDNTICNLNNEHLILRTMEEHLVETRIHRSKARVDAHFSATEAKVAATIALIEKVAKM